MDRHERVSASQMRDGPLQQASPPRKRRRKALSCYECRRRKVKCDRGAPACNRCMETGQGRNCSYTLEPPGHELEHSLSADEEGNEHEVAVRRVEDMGAAAVTVPDELSVIVRMQAKRISQLEERLLAAFQAKDTLPSREWKDLEQVVAASKLSLSDNSMSKMQPYVEQQEPKSRETIPVRGGKGFETKFYGASNPTSVLGYFPELHSFLKEALSYNQSLADINRRLQIIDQQRKTEKVTPVVSHESLVALLPRREIVDHLVELYFEKFETTYRILHQPSFWNEYETFWLDPPKGSSGFVATILLVIATVVCYLSRTQFGLGETIYYSRDVWILWVETSEMWLGLQSQKHLNILGIKEKRAWMSACAMLTFGMSAGLHRDPSLLSGRISIFDQEMRRRLWATIVELEIEASIERGMKPFSADLPSDCPPPSNLDDGDFSIQSDRLPAEKSGEIFTGTSFLRVLQKSRALRTYLICLINDPRSNLEYGEVLRHEAKLLQLAKEIPIWGSGSDPVNHPSSLPRMLLGVQLRGLILLLHSPWARRTDSDPRYSYSRIVCLNNAKYILDDLSTATKSADYTLLFLRKDVERSALSICHNLYISSISPSSDISSLIPGSSIFPVIDTALSLLEEKISRLNVGYKNYLFLSAAYSLIISREWSAQLDMQKYEAVERVTRLNNKVLALSGVMVQQNSVSSGGMTELSAVSRAAPHASPSQAFPFVNLSSTAIPPAAAASTDMPYEAFDYNDFSEWSMGSGLWPLYSLQNRQQQLP